MTGYFDKPLVEETDSGEELSEDVKEFVQEIEQAFS